MQEDYPISGLLKIRELLKMTERPEVISFAGGLPASELFPHSGNQGGQRLCAGLLRRAGPSVYDHRRLPAAAQMDCGTDELPAGNVFDEDNIMITHGSQQALDLTGKVFLEEGMWFCAKAPRIWRPSALSGLTAADLPRWKRMKMGW